MNAEKKPASSKKKRSRKKADSVAEPSRDAADSEAKNQQIPASTSFEDALGELQTIVESLESGDQALEKSLLQFERGISLARFCQNNLQAAEQKIMLLSGDKGIASDEALEPFDPSESVED